MTKQKRIYELLKKPTVCWGYSSKQLEELQSEVCELIGEIHSL